jgi:hypothetical protein
MKTSKLLALAILLTLSLSSAWAQVPKALPGDEDEGPGITGLAFSLVKKVPGDFGRAIETYLETVRPQDYGGDGKVAQNNRGIIEHFEREMSKDPCFLRVSEELYADNQVNFNLEETPRIKSNLKSLNKPEYQPGWLWKKALSLSGGNPNLAVKAIAFCGHDDVNRDEICPPRSFGHVHAGRSRARCRHVSGSEGLRDFNAVDSRQPRSDPR